MLGNAGMKTIAGIIPAMKANAVIDELRSLQIENLITSNVSVPDKEHGHEMIYRGCVYREDSSSKVKVEVNVSDRDAERAESLLTHAV
jgi:nitrogen regulatory protein PII